MRKAVVNQLHRKRRCEEMLQGIPNFDTSADLDQLNLDWQEVAKVLARHYRCEDCRARNTCPMELLQLRYDQRLRVDQN